MRSSSRTRGSCKMWVMNEHPSLGVKGSGGTVLSPKGAAPATSIMAMVVAGISTGDARPRVCGSNPGARTAGPRHLLD